MKRGARLRTDGAPFLSLGTMATVAHGLGLMLSVAFVLTILFAS